MSDDDADEEAEVIEEREIEPLPQVAASESDVIMMARALVGRSGNDDIWAMLTATRTVAPKIGPTAAAILEDTLRHTWRSLWLRGGSRPSASLRGGASVRGRLWERHDPTALAFSASTLRFLRWLVQTPFAAPASTLSELPAAPLTVGDQVIIYLALDATRSTPAQRSIAIQPFVRAAPLAWLGFPHLLAGRGTKVPAFDSVVEGSGAIVIEAIGSELAKRWVTIETQKRATTDPAELIDLGTAQDAVLTGFMKACDAKKRRDLAVFVIEAAIQLLARNITPLMAELDPKAPLSTRMQARVAAGSLLRALVRWSDWDQQHRGIRFIDDDYAAAQLLLERFEPIGSAGASRAQQWLADLAALAPTTPVDPAAAGAMVAPRDNT